MVGRKERDEKRKGKERKGRSGRCEEKGSEFQDDLNGRDGTREPN